jgi:hypothetical protein
LDWIYAVIEIRLADDTGKSRRMEFEVGWLELGYTDSKGLINEVVSNVLMGIRGVNWRISDEFRATLPGVKNYLSLSVQPGVQVTWYVITSAMRFSLRQK